MKDAPALKLLDSEKTRGVERRPIRVGSSL